MAVEKSNLELEKYKEERKKIEYKNSLTELEKDIKQIVNNGEEGIK